MRFFCFHSYRVVMQNGSLGSTCKHLLTYISGLGPQLAQNIVDYRAVNGAFSNRKQLMKVPKMGVKTFEPCS
jgi:uncharacterized protein